VKKQELKAKKVRWKKKKAWGRLKNKWKRKRGVQVGDTHKSNSQLQNTKIGGGTGKGNEKRQGFVEKNTDERTKEPYPRDNSPTATLYSRRA